MRWRPLPSPLRSAGLPAQHQSESPECLPQFGAAPPLADRELPPPQPALQEIPLPSADKPTPRFHVDRGVQETPVDWAATTAAGQPHRRNQKLKFPPIGK